MSGRPSILVTGATGFLGGRVVERLVLEGRAEVKAVARSAGRAARIASLPVSYWIGDVTDDAGLTEAARGCSWIVNCASRIEPGKKAEETTTFLSARSSARACLQTGARLVHISSCSVYGTPSQPLVNESAPLRPRHRHDTYARAKIAAESHLKSLASTSGLIAAIIQPTMIYGPYSEEWTNTPLAMLRASNVAMPENDRSVCNAVFVDDVVNAILLAMDRCDRSCPSYLINGADLPTWTGFLQRHSTLGTAGKVVSVPPEKIAAIHAAGRKQRSVVRTALRIVREQPQVRSALLSTGLIGGVFGLAQRVIPRGTFEVARKRIRGGEIHAVGSLMPQEASVPLSLPLPHFLTLATETHRFSIEKARRDLGFEPRFTLDRAFALIGQWARWSRLVPEAETRAQDAA